MEFEINYLVLQSHTEDFPILREKVKKLIEANKGSIIDKLEYRKRKLAYKIKHELYGFFSVFRFTMEENDTIRTLKKDLNLHQDVARYIIVRADELPALKEEIIPAEQERQQMEEKDTIKQEEVEKILSGKKLSKRLEQKEKKAQREPEEKPEVEKEIQGARIEKKPQKEAEEKKSEEEKDEKSSLEDLDKKLDEILNI